MGSEKYWHNAFEVDLMGPVRAAEVLIPRMEEQGGGSIVLIATTSIAEAMGGPQAYNALKASLVTWGKQMALFHGKNGVRVNVVSPGPVEFGGGNWEMIKGTMEKFYNAQLRQHSADLHQHPAIPRKPGGQLVQRFASCGRRRFHQPDAVLRATARWM